VAKGIQDEITIHLEGLPQDAGDVRLPVLIEKLNDLRRALNASDLAVTNQRKPTTYYRVVNLSHKSPAAITVAACPLDTDSDYGGKVFEYLLNGVSFIRGNRSIPKDATDPFITSIVGLLDGLKTKYSRIWLEFPDHKIASIDQELSDAIDEVLGRAYVGKGSIKGAVERFNSHNEPLYFYIYPPIGTRSVKCVFSRDLLDKAVNAVNKNVTVLGTLKYRPNQLFPYECFVDDIQTHQPDNELPTLSELFNIAPDATGNLGTVDFIRKVRSEWQ